MLEIEKLPVARQEYVVNLNGSKIPLQAILAPINMLVLVLMVVYAVNATFTAANESVKTTSWICNEGIYDAVSHQWMKCHPTAEMDIAGKPNIAWACDRQNTSFATIKNPFAEYE